MRKLTVLATFFFLMSCSGTGSEEDAQLYEIAAEFNKKCPQMVDSETRIDGIEIKEPGTIIYKYTLVNLPAEHVDTTAFRKALWPGILSVVKLSPEMKTLRDRNTHFAYTYSDKSGKLIYTFKILPEDYNP